MSLYVIGDLHLSFSDNQIENKPMNIFGGNWDNHAEKIKKDWQNKVKPEDTVILAGDFSWATYLEDTYKDFEFINKLPGKKIMLKGNHDYWWTTITSMKKYLKEQNIENVEFLYNNSFEIENKIIVGTRGWVLNDTENAEKMINREAQRLELSIKDGLKNINIVEDSYENNVDKNSIGNSNIKSNKIENNKEIIAIMHYPPVIKGKMKNEYTYNSKFLDIMKKYKIKRCYYGHLHGESHKDAVEGNIEGIELKLISSDYLNFKLYEIK